jgi:hypothetical protein
LREPYPHQLEVYGASVDRECAALFLEQRVGKTLICVYTAAERHRRGDVTGTLVVLHPNGGQHEWAYNWPLDWPEDIPHQVVPWRSSKMGDVDRRGVLSSHALNDLLKADGTHRVLAMNCEAILTKLGWAVVGKFLRSHRCLVVADESSFMKSPSSQRTRRMLAIGRHPNAVVRRVLDGTPAAEGSLDLWAPCAFLDWRLLGHQSYFTFRSRYAVMTTGYGPGGRQFNTQAVDERGNKLYQNLDELQRKLARFSFRVRRADVSDAPPPEFSEVFFELTPRQRRVYDRLELEYEAEWQAGTFPVPLAITRYLRLQMISRNWLPSQRVGVPCPGCGGRVEGCDHCEGAGVVVQGGTVERVDEEANPALEAFVARATTVVGQAVYWCRFRQDVSDVVEALSVAGAAVGRYDGSVLPADRQRAYDDFRAGKLDAIVCTTGSGISRGHDLSCASAVGYYSNSYVLRDRLQSQDRTESLRRRSPTEVFDLIGVDTRDLPIIEALRAKQSVAALLQGDPR